jgi:hypothetical protein
MFAGARPTEMVQARHYFVWLAASPLRVRRRKKISAAALTSSFSQV